jgi:hypothetical protein
VPLLLHPHVQPPEHRVAGAVHGAVDRVVEVAVGVVDAADDRRARVAADQAEAETDLPVARELVTADRGQDVGLVEVEQPVRLVRVDEDLATVTTGDVQVVSRTLDDRWWGLGQG